MRKAYQTDFSDAEWSCLEAHLLALKANGRPRIYPLRKILDAIFYVVKSGCQWRLLPHDFPPWKTVERTFSWLSQNRRLSKGYERLPESAEAFIYVAMSRLMVRRLARS